MKDAKRRRGGAGLLSLTIPRTTTILPEHPETYLLHKNHIARVIDPTHTEEEAPLTHRYNPHEFRPANKLFKSIDVQKELERIRNVEKRSFAITPNQFKDPTAHNTSSSLADDLHPILDHVHCMSGTKDSNIVNHIDFLDVPKKGLKPSVLRKDISQIVR